MKKVLITGGAGFIGSRFVSHLLHQHLDYRLVVLDLLTYAGGIDNFPQGIEKNANFRFYHGNVRNTGIVDELVSQADVVFHFAAETHVPRSIADTVTVVETDVLGTQVVANAAVKLGVERFVHISSSEVYGSALAAPMTEEHPLNPRTPYASAKAGADRLVYSYHMTFGLPAVIVRPFNTYGPHQHLEKVIPRFITSAIMSEPLSIHGDGSHTRDWIYVEDLCEALDKLLDIDIGQLQGEAINLGTGVETSIGRIAELVLEELDRPRSLLTLVEDRPGQVSRHLASIDKARRLLDWAPTTAFETGLKRTIQWYSENRQWWKPRLWMRSVTVTDPAGKLCTY